MKRLARFLLWVLAVGALLVVALRLVYPPPEAAPSASRALPPASTGPLATGISNALRGRDGLTGILPVSNGLDAFTARLALVRAATRSIDARYYIWHRDMTGLVLMKALLDAANRGVKVRLLVDDNGTSGFDREFAAFAAHGNMEVRIFNPFMLRSPRLLNYAFDFFRLNRRMHNKSIIIDGQATILGGRNVGDEYFAAGSGSLFVDLDVLAVGSAVEQDIADFDSYWASASAIPAESVIDPAIASTTQFEQDAAEALKSREFADYREALGKTDLVARIAAGQAAFRWASARLFSDDPAKGQGPVKSDSLLMGRLFEAAGAPKASLSLVSPYFIPGTQGTATFSRWAREGVRVQVLTNAMEATDVLPVHAGYAKYRPDLLAAGVGLYELKRQAVSRQDRNALGLVGSSASSLHAKTFSIDGERIFVGSFNFDPRSLLLNCEMGLLIDDSGLAGELDRVFGAQLLGSSYRVKATPDGGLVWETREGNTTTEIPSEPGSSALRSLALTVIGWLPIEWLL